MASLPNVPTLKEATGLDWQFVNWFALTLPKGVPADVTGNHRRAGQEGACPRRRAGPMKERGITPVWETSDEARAFAAKFSTTAGQLLKEIGLAKE